MEFEVFEKGEVRRGREWFRQAPKGEGSSFSGGSQGFVNIEKFRSEISRFQEGVRVLKEVLKL